MRVVGSGGRVVVSEPDWDTLVVDAADKAVTRTIRQRICDDHCQGWIGRQLAALASQCGLTDLAVYGITVPFTGWSPASQLLGLSRAEAVVAEGLVAPEAAAAWIDDLVQRDAAGPSSVRPTSLW